ncbi:MAG: restriction endonuclease, partial [Okeania sp. SIO2B9]|nr:restriction endonuclease [Okeania sp. SIO2B9]
ETHNLNMSETEIKQKFQLLKKDSAGNHNLLKSRSCEFCIKTVH